MFAGTFVLCTALKAPLGWLEEAVLVTPAKALHQQFAASEASLLQGCQQHSEPLHGIHGSSS